MTFVVGSDSLYEVDEYAWLQMSRGDAMDVDPPPIDEEFDEYDPSWQYITLPAGVAIYNQTSAKQFQLTSQQLFSPVDLPGDKDNSGLKISLLGDNEEANNLSNFREIYIPAFKKQGRKGIEKYIHITFDASQATLNTNQDGNPYVNKLVTDIFGPAQETALEVTALDCDSCSLNREPLTGQCFDVRETTLCTIDHRTNGSKHYWAIRIDDLMEDDLNWANNTWGIVGIPIPQGLYTVATQVTIPWDGVRHWWRTRPDVDNNRDNSGGWRWASTSASNFIDGRICAIRNNINDDPALPSGSVSAGAYHLNQPTTVPLGFNKWNATFSDELPINFHCFGDTVVKLPDTRDTGRNIQTGQSSQVCLNWQSGNPIRVDFVQQSSQTLQISHCYVAWDNDTTTATKWLFRISNNIGLTTEIDSILTVETFPYPT